MYRDLQKLSGPRLISRTPTQRFFDITFFELVEIRRKMESISREMCSVIPVGVWLVGTVLKRYRFPGGREGDGPFDRVFQFANISEPRAICERRERVISDRDLLARAC